MNSPHHNAIVNNVDFCGTEFFEKSIDGALGSATIWNITGSLSNDQPNDPKKHPSFRTSQDRVLDTVKLKYNSLKYSFRIWKYDGLATISKCCTFHSALCKHLSLKIFNYHTNNFFLADYGKGVWVRPWFKLIHQWTADLLNTSIRWSRIFPHRGFFIHCFFIFL